LHVVLLSVEYPPFIYGGVGTFVNNLAIGLRREGVRVTVISGYPVPSHVNRLEIDEEIDPELNVIRFPYFDMHPKNAIFQLRNLKKICETIKNINPDLIHGQGLSTFPASIKLKNLAPLVVTFHSSPKADKTIGVYSLLRGGSFSDFWTYVFSYPASSLICRNELRDSKMAVAVSRSLMSELLEEMGETYRGKICEINNGIDIETLDRNYKNVEHDVEETNDTMLFAGRLVWGKGALNLIKIAYLLQKEKSDLKLIVHGDGPHFKTLKKKVREFELTNVELKGFESGAQFMRSMRRSRFTIIPSYREVCPMILLESMCLGKIPVMFNLPFSLEFTENGKYGIIAKDTKDMVDQLRIASMKFDLKSFGDQVKDFAKRKYNIKNMSLKYLNLYNSIRG
jgi:glycosyltransferase involved in cell wall biosynthesis